MTEILSVCVEEVMLSAHMHIASYINTHTVGYIMMLACCLFPACPLVGQVTSTCASSCPWDCLRPGNESCVQLCDMCTCPPPTIADYITGKCVQPEQCTGKLYSYQLTE